MGRAWEILAIELYQAGVGTCAGDFLMIMIWYGVDEVLAAHHSCSSRAEFRYLSRDTVMLKCNLIRAHVRPMLRPDYVLHAVKP